MAKKKSSEQQAQSQNESGKVTSLTLPNSAEPLDEWAELEGIGAATIVRSYEPFEGLPTGSLSLDWAVGNGRGIPRGQITMFYGPEGCGKTTLATLAGINTVSSGGKVVVFNMERRWNVEYAFKSGMGYPGKDYMLISPDTQEDFFNYLVYFAGKDYDLAICDSVTAAPPRIEFEEESIEGGFKTVQARNFSTFFRMRMKNIALSRMAVIFISQVRVGMDQYEPVVIPGGKALKYYTSVRVKLEKPPFDDFEHEAGISKADKQKHLNPIGLTITGKTDKNNLAPPYRPVQVAIRFDNGLSVDFAEEVCEYGAQYGVLTGKSGGKPGHWYYLGRHLGDTREQAKAVINEEVDLRRELTRLIREQMIGG